ncbi:hypothetical protein LFX25_05250 [Leptospira sp. FAT2]|uniref:hypothetical protein n=1 Tax=Leptospira sanjuanensis TaxID=2879643 RepID=UPI001EE7BDE5|nr:hypothetical protein [Leptospira sanjuanensis]MCG6192642.1 hypothetical protein [Leptospira sanjuanensis]
MKFEKQGRVIFVIGCILLVLPLFGGEKEELKAVKEDINVTGRTCSCFKLVTSSEDAWVYGVNYYIDTFKQLMKSSHKEEAKKKVGNKRKWIVSKSQGVGESIYFHTSYSGESGIKVLNDAYSLNFKNYCEADGKKEEYSRIKSAKLTFMEAPYTLVNNANTPRLDASFKKTKEFDVEIGESDEIVSILPAYTVLGTQKGAGEGGNVVVVKLTVTGVYPGKKSPLCAQDFFMGGKSFGKYTDLVKQVDEINK